MNFKPYNYTETELQQRIEQIVAGQAMQCDRSEALKCIFQSIDFTSLNATDNKADIEAFCGQALAFAKTGHHLSVPAICIYSPFVKQAKQQLSGSGIKVATVACAFPSGQMPFKLKKEEVAYCVEQGADEVDMVISRGTFLHGDHIEVFNEIKEIKTAHPKTCLKVILETGELKTIENIRKASELAILAGADFIKTSTGKATVAATPLAAIIMIDTINEYHAATGKKVGFKPAGGMKTPEDALTYYYLVKGILGTSWLNKDLFRVGTSRLAQQIIDAI